MAKYWTKEDLHNLIAERLAGVKFIVVSNREPYIHRHSGNGIECILPASGMATAIDPIMRASEGIWVAHGGGDADRLVVDQHDHIRVPPGEESYTLRRVWLDAATERGYYMGLSNSGIWPLCHIVYQRPKFRQSDWDDYRRANQIFADAVIEEAGDGPAFVFIQDYHFALLPRMLKQRNPKLIVAQFWHIPWPNRETFRVFPWKEELLDGLLGNDLLGFHLRYHCANFLETIDRNIEGMVDTEHFKVTRGGHETTVRPFPISIDFHQHDVDARDPNVDEQMNWWIEQIGQRPDFIGAGIDRIDYTKGIPDRLMALDLLLERQPELRGRLVFVQIAVPSRSDVEDYALLAQKLDDQVAAINNKWRSGAWEPVFLLKAHCKPDRMMALHRLANFFVVTSLHDGMNLVAKEFVASRFDQQGVLLLSQFTGSARELNEALQVNPFSPDEVAAAMNLAIVMRPEEQARRMTRLRTAVEENNIYRWAGKFLSILLKFEFADRRENEELAYFAESVMP